MDSFYIRNVIKDGITEDHPNGPPFVMDLFIMVMEYLTVVKTVSGFTINDVKHGKWLTLYPDYNVAHCKNYKNGRLHGECKSWYTTGQLQKHTQYVNGKVNGFSKEWHLTGELLSTSVIIDGKGCERSFYVSGFFQRITYYKNHKKTGVEREWWENKNRKSEGRYKNGKKIGLWTEWHDNEIKHTIGSYSKGEKTGVWMEWNRDGVLVGNVSYGDSKTEDTSDSNLDNINSLLVSIK